MNKKNIMKALRNFSRVFIGLVFIFSGFVKVIDPIGVAYKFNDYFAAMHLEFLSGGALTFAVLMSVAELLIGIALTFNLLPKLASWAVLIFMVIFTPLTLWLAIANPVSDCGCFGDALILTNWQTFFKNVIIDIFVVIIFIERKRFKPAYSPFFQWSLGIVFAIASFFLAFYCLRNLPIIDFRPYHIGANIQEGMTIPENEKENVDIIESSFIYEKNGNKKSFELNDLPDDSWTFIEAKHKVIKEGYKPPIHDFTIEPIYIEGFNESPAQTDFVNLYDYQFEFLTGETSGLFTIDMLPDNSWSFVNIIPEGSIDPSLIKLVYLNPDNEQEIFSINNLPSHDYIFLDAEYEDGESADFVHNYGEDITLQVLSKDNYAFFLIMTYVEEANTENIDRMNDIALFCKENSYDFYCLTGSSEDKIKLFTDEHNPSFNFYSTDPTTLKTIIRSNPGLMLTYKGTVLDKWAYRNIPEIKDMQSDLAARSITKLENKNADNISYAYILGLFLFMSLFHNFYRWLKNKKFINN